MKTNFSNNKNFNAKMFNAIKFAAMFVAAKKFSGSDSYNGVQSV